MQKSPFSTPESALRTFSSVKLVWRKSDVSNKSTRTNELLKKGERAQRESPLPSTGHFSKTLKFVREFSEE